MAVSEKQRVRFKLRHKETGLLFGEFKTRYPVNYHTSNGNSYTDRAYFDVALIEILRADGAIGFQVKKPVYDEGELYFLNRDEWIVQWKEEI